MILQGGVIDKNEEMIKRRLSQSIQYLGPMYADSHKAEEDLYSFAKNNDQRQFRLMRTCMDPTIDVKTISKSQVIMSKNRSSSPNLISTLVRIFQADRPRPKLHINQHFAE